MHLTKEEIEFLEEHYRKIEAGEDTKPCLLEPYVIGSPEHAAQLIKLYFKAKGETEEHEAGER